jgi:hypothetical protein
MGYVNLDAVGFGAAPSPTYLQLFEDRWTTATTNDVNKVNAWFGWYEIASPGGFIPLNKPYLLLHRGHAAYKLEKGLGPYTCTRRGVWTLTGKTIEVV